MFRFGVIAASLFGAFVVVGCSTADSEGQSIDSSVTDTAIDIDASVTTESPTYHRDIKPILDTMCVRCHSDGGVRASVPLDSEENAVLWADVIRDQVLSRTMPPWKATDGCREYRHDESLTEEEIERIAMWVEDGALPGIPTDAPVEARFVDFATLSRVDVEVEMPVEYTPKLIPDDYRCFLLPWQEETKTYITGFGALPGNPEVVHHVIAYLIEPQAVEEFIAWEEAEDDPGYTCFGGPSGPGGPATVLSAPVGPVGPSAPAGPVGPAGPSGPGGPAGPLAPMIPCGPSGPLGPTPPCCASTSQYRFFVGS